ncbi:Proline-rich AKT1 substrate [Apis cerana cerana]|uniref:Proline-rich AKT1 substrate n=2 Tax=Apis cerana TaxID=7461 RepID=A0A2A3EDF1_APICC|nr:Proline-rich AKT1 substrate [Apis cerana cerana]
MHIACKCLNVSIKSRGTELQKFNINDIELTLEEQNDSFFHQNLATVSELEGITKEQPSLVEIRNIGSWIIHRCYNCSIYTHAVHRDYGAALVLINTDILSLPEEINKLRSNPDYSSVFRIVIAHNTLDELDYLQQPNKFSVSQLPNNIQVALGGLQQQLEEAVQRQSVEIENKIRAFTAEQYQLLEQFRERAHNEHRILTRLICKGEEITRLTNNIETPPVTPDSFTTSLTTSATNTVNTSQIVSNETKIIANSNVKHETGAKYSSNSLINGSIDKKDRIYIYTKEPTSFDTEALFPLEGMEDTLNADQVQSSEEGSDTDDSGQDEGIHMSRGQRGGHPTLAKSLPVSVPSFPSFVRRTVQDQDDDQLSRDPHDPHNIRASIKALAKSVHGDTVFGDLPRPRFSTQI